MNENRRERGQVLVLILLAIVGIFGLLALAVDGGRIYAERRRAQAAADAGAYAAAFAAMMGKTETVWRSEAMSQIILNGYDDTSSLDNGQEIDVMIYWPPLDGATHPERYEDRPSEFLQVIIRTKVDPIFSQFVFGGPISMTVEAIVQVTQYNSAYNGAAMVSTGESQCAAAKFHGTQKLNIYNGDVYIHSNKCVDCTAIDHVGNGKIKINNGKISTQGCIDYSPFADGMIADNGIFTEVAPLSVPPYPVPDCVNLIKTETSTVPLPVRSYSKSDSTLEPGLYPGGIKVTGPKTAIKLNPGMYCVENGFSMQGGQIIGENVIIVILSGSVDVGGNVIVHLDAPDHLLDAQEQNWAGMLMYMPFGNKGTITLSGGGNSDYTGTVYAPDETIGAKAKCKLIGNTNTLAFNTQMICYDIDVGGTADLNIYYEQKQQYQPPPTLRLSK